jgi:hypothetical protein
MHQVFRRNPEARKSEIPESLDYEFRIAAIRSNQEIDISGKSSISVPGDGKGADDKILNSLQVQ